MQRRIKAAQMEFNFGDRKLGGKPGPDSYRKYSMELEGERFRLVSGRYRARLEKLLCKEVGTAWSITIMQSIRAGGYKEAAEGIKDAAERFDESHRFFALIPEIAVQFRMHLMLSGMEKALAGGSAEKFLQEYDSLLPSSQRAKSPSKKEAASRLLVDAALEEIAGKFRKIAQAG